MSDPLTPEEREQLRDDCIQQASDGICRLADAALSVVAVIAERDQLEQERDALARCCAARETALDDVCVRAIAHLHALGHLAAAHELRKMRRKAKAATHPAEEPEEPTP